MTNRHNSRELVLVGGRPGSGATWLAQEVVRQEEQAGRTAEYISVSETIRGKIGGLALASSYANEVLAHLRGEHSHELLPSDIVAGIIHETTYRYDGVDTLVIEDFPRTFSQLLDLKELIDNSKRYPLGMLNAVATEPTALRRLALRSDERRLTPDQQQAYLHRHDQTSAGIRRALLESGIMINDVDTDGAENETLNDRMVSITMAQTVLKELRDLREK